MSRRHPRKRTLRHLARLTKQRRRNYPPGDIWGKGIVGILLSAHAETIRELLHDAGYNHAVPHGTTQVAVTKTTNPTPILAAADILAQYNNPVPSQRQHNAKIGPGIFVQSIPATHPN